MTYKELVTMAYEACKNSYAPYSDFHVGAALMTDDGRVFTGCNVENASYGACICAERTAAVKAISEGAKRFSAIAIVNSRGGLTYPCGICRQFLSEFASEDFKVILEDENKEIVSFSMGDLMPYGFKF